MADVQLRILLDDLAQQALEQFKGDLADVTQASVAPSRALDGLSAAGGRLGTELEVVDAVLAEVVAGMGEAFAEAGELAPALNDVAAGMTYAAAGTRRWDEGLRRLAEQEQAAAQKAAALAAPMDRIAAGMSQAASGAAKWEEGLRRLALQQQGVAATTAATGEAASRAGEQTRQGLGKVANAVENLAGNLLGVNNQVGNVVSGLLSFTVGGPVVAGVAAGIAVVTGALLYLSQTARAAQAAYDRFLDSLQQQSPLAVVGGQIDALTEKLSKPLSQLTLFEAFDRLFNGKADLRQLEQAKGIYQDILDSFNQSREQARSAAAVVLPELEVVARATGWAAGEWQKLLRELARNPIPQQLFQKAEDTVGRERSAPQVRLGDVGGFLPPAAVEQVNRLPTLFERIQASLDLMGLSMEHVGETFRATFVAAVAGAKNFADATIRAVGAAVKGTAKVLGQEQMAKAAGKFAEALWPPNPAAFLSGLKHVAAGALFFALAGGGGGGGISGGGGGGGTSVNQGITDRQRQVIEAQDRELVVYFERGAFIDPENPQFQDTMGQVIRKGIRAGRIRMSPR